MARLMTLAGVAESDGVNLDSLMADLAAAAGTGTEEQSVLADGEGLP